MQALTRLSLTLLLLLTSISPALAQQDTPTEPSVLSEGIPADPPAEIAADTLAAIRQHGTLHVGLSTYAPWAMYANNGELIGFEVDVAQQLADDIGVDVEFHLDGWVDLLPDLLHGDFDVIISGMSITPQRALLVNFSNPYHFNETVLLAHSPSTEGRTTISDFNQAETLIGAWEGSVGQSLAVNAFPEAEVRSFASEVDMFTAVRNGDVHAVIAASPRPQFEVLLHPEKVHLPLNAPLTTFGAGMAIRKGDADFLRYLDSWILYHTLNGWLAERRGYWFNSLGWAERMIDAE